MEKKPAAAGYLLTNTISMRRTLPAPRSREADFRGKAENMRNTAPAVSTDHALHAGHDGQYRRTNARYPVGIMPVMDPEDGELVNRLSAISAPATLIAWTHHPGRKNITLSCRGRMQESAG